MAPFEGDPIFAFILCDYDNNNVKNVKLVSLKVDSNGFGRSGGEKITFNTENDIRIFKNGVATKLELNYNDSTLTVSDNSSLSF